MSNIFTQSVSPEFTKQSLTEFFVDPMFMGQDIRGAITVRTDIKGTEKLNRISRPTMITKAKTTAGFTPNGEFALSTKDITVKPMAIEFEQNAREFWDTVVQEMLAQGYKEDDIENMSNPDIWNKIILPIIAQAGQQDLIRQMWFNDSDSSDDNYNGYDGFFKHFKDLVTAGSIQHFSFGSTTSGIEIDETDSTLDKMVSAMPNEMLGLNSVFRMSRKAYRNLLASWKALGTETANMIQFNGVSVPSYEGIPIIVHPEWDTYAPQVGFNFPGIIVLGPSANLLFATDGSTDSEMIESWYNQDEQMRRYRVQYKAQTAYLHNELIVTAGLPSY